MAYTVKAVAERAGVSVRTLHYYDDIGLLKPASVSASGYRLYTDADLERLQQVLFFRALDFSLQDIQSVLENPGFDRKQALLTHKKMLLERERRIRTLVRTIDRTIASMEGGAPMSADKIFDGLKELGGPDAATLEAYKKEAYEKYDKKLVDESYRRTSKYSKVDWTAILKESGEITNAIAGRMEEGPGDAEVQRRVAQWHQLINDRYYPCSLEIFRGLGDLYVQDGRFAANYEKVKPGLAAFMREAMLLYCHRQEGKAQ